jgi:hypothetical protein
MYTFRGDILLSEENIPICDIKPFFSSASSSLLHRFWAEMDSKAIALWCNTEFKLIEDMSITA